MEYAKTIENGRLERRGVSEAVQYFKKYPADCVFFNKKLNLKEFFFIEGVIYQYKKTLGEGEDGLVVLAKSISDSTLIALKMPNPRSTEYSSSREEYFSAVNWEARILQKVGDLIGLCHEDKGYSKNSYESFIGMRFILGEPLENHMETNKDLWGYKEYSTIVRRLSKSIEKLHDLGIAHLDLHFGNVLVVGMDSNGLPSKFEIIDFGRSQEVPPGGSVRTVKLMMNDFYDVIDYGIRRRLQQIKDHYKVLPKYHELVDNMMNLRRDILDPERPTVDGRPANHPRRTYLNFEEVRDITLVARGIIEGVSEESRHEFSETWKRITEEDDIEIIFLNSETTKPSPGSELFIKFLLEGRTIADVRFQRELGTSVMDEIMWGPTTIREDNKADSYFR